MTNSPQSFADFGVEQSITDALADAGISTPFPIQEITLPLALTGADIIGQARTGTGKTLAFGIPLLQRVDPDRGSVEALVIVPTRELCLQVTGDLNEAGVRKGVDVAAVYGGRAIEPQEEAIAGGASIVVGTPGRLLDLLRRGSLRLGGVTGLVLDEADEMLDLGFLPDVEQLIEATAADRQTMLFSATMPSQVVALARRYMRKPTFLRADVEEVHVAPQTKQHFFACHRMDKPAVLARILQSPSRGLCVVFTRTKRMADVLAEELRERGVSAAPIHSDLRQEARERALDRFRSGRIDVLVATEVAARGLDITDVTHVVNYDCPDDEKMYLHRIGRTGRAGAAGVAITLAVWNELARVEMIKRALDIEEETHEVFSTSPILDELFDLPPRRPRAAREERAQPDDADASDEVASAEDGGDGRAAPARASTSGNGGARGRSRGRRRRRGGGPVESDDRVVRGTAPSAAAVTADADAVDTVDTADTTTADPDAAPNSAPDGPKRRVRVRRRTRSAATSDEAAPPVSSQPAASEPAPAQPAAAAATDAAPVPEETSAAPPATSKRREAPTGSGASARRSGTRRTSGRRRSTTTHTDRHRRREPASDLPSSVARGDGQPTLHRRMSITHLP